MMDFLPFQFTDFHGGISDNFIDTAQFRYENADNFLVTENKKLYTRPGSVIWDSTNYQIPVGQQRIAAIIDHYDSSSKLLFVSGKKFYHVVSGAWSTLQGPTSNDVYSVGGIDSISSWGEWNKFTYVTNGDFSPVMKIFKNNAGTLRVINAGLPKLASSPTVTGAAGANNYIYAFVYFYTYQRGTTTFSDYGSPVYVQKELIDEPSSSNVSVTAIPVLSNGVTNNYDTTVIKVRVFRTLNNGTTFFYVGEVTNGTTTFTDSYSDSTISNNATFYITSGELEHDSPPLCKVLHITDTMALYGHIKLSSGEILSNRVVQSIPDDPDSAPGSLYVDLDDEVVAISSAGQTPVVLCKKSIYRLDGAFTATGEGLLQAQEIESTVGCISVNSVTQIQRGIVFAGEGGFYFTDGWEVRKLSSSWNDRYKTFIATEAQRNRIYGCFDRTTKRVWFSVQETGQTDSNKYYVLDTRYGLGVAGDDLEDVNVCFTPVYNGTNFAPTASIFIDGILYRGDRRGYIFKHDTPYKSDPLINTALNPSLWDVIHIPWKFTSMATSFGTTLKRKFCPKMVFVAENDTNVSVQVTNINDIGKQIYDLVPIRFRKNCTWDTPEPTWGDEDAIWNFDGIIQEERKFQSEGLRCMYKQIQLANAYVQIINSDNLGTVTTNANTNTVVLENIVDYKWPSNMQEYYIYFSYNNYSKGYRILGRTDTTLTIEDLANDLQAKNGENFIVKGYPKDEVLNLISVAMWYAYLGGPTQYAAASAGSTPA